MPGPAPNLQAVSNTPTSVSLSWDKPLTGNGDVVTYKLYYADKSVGTEQVGCSRVDFKELADTVTSLISDQRIKGGAETGFDDIHTRVFFRL